MVRNKNEYPTFGDVVSDWETVAADNPALPKDKKPNEKK